MSTLTSKDRPADSAAREEAWHSFANSEPAPTHKDCFHAGWVSGKGYARLAPETSVQPVTWRRLIDSAYTLKPEWIYTNQRPTVAPEKWEPLYPNPVQKALSP
jgi:hypothetical protein